MYEGKVSFLNGEERRKWYGSLSLSNNRGPLAYFLYKNYNLSIETKVKYLRTYFKLTKEDDDFDLNDIRNALEYLDKGKRQSKEQSNREWNRMIAIVSAATGNKLTRIPKVKFT